MNRDQINYIDTSEALQQLCDQLKNEAWIALDTEFLREKTYRPQLCLLQLGTESVTACIDPLALDNLDPLLILFDNPNITKVFHSGSQDLEILYQLNGRLPQPLFDTQIAAPLLGYSEQIGYANLVKESLGVELEKAHSRADWSRRPLPKGQLRYAADDVIYLGQLYLKLRAELEQRGRLVWLEEDFTALADAERYRVNPASAWMKLRGLDRLRSQALSIVQTVASWREEQAERRNLPRKWLLKDEVVFDLALQKPADIEQMSHIRGLSDRFVESHGTELLQLIGQASEQKPQPLPAAMKKKRHRAEDEAVADLLMALVRQRAEENTLNPAVICQRKELLRLIQGERDLTLLSGWRKQMVGRELLQLLSGEASLAIVAGKLALQTASGT